MFHLPTDIIQKIYEYDSTYHERFDIVLDEMVDEKMRMMTKFMSEDKFWIPGGLNEEWVQSSLAKIHDEYDSCYEIMLSPSSDKYHMSTIALKFIVLTDDEVDKKAKEWIEENYDLMDNEFLAAHTGLTLEGVECLRNHLSDMGFKCNMYCLIRDWIYFTDDALDCYGVEHYFEMMYPSLENAFYSDEQSSYFIWIDDD